jgi:hypothetical protein
LNCTSTSSRCATAKAVPYRPGRLQRTILGIALRNRELEGRTGFEDSGADVLYTEAVIEDIKCPASIRDHDGRRVYSETVFTLEKIGKTDYLAARASVGAAMRKLEKRGLVITVRGMTGWLGANLTEEGVKVAQWIRVARPRPQQREADSAKSVAGAWA